MRFLDSIERSAAEAEEKAVYRLLALGRAGETRALMWFLERRFPERWGRRSRKDPFQEFLEADHPVLDQVPTDQVPIGQMIEEAKANSSDWLPEVIERLRRAARARNSELS
jgi:hypothetical protein